MDADDDGRGRGGSRRGRDEGARAGHAAGHGRWACPSLGWRLWTGAPRSAPVSSGLESAASTVPRPVSELLADPVVHVAVYPELGAHSPSAYILCSTESRNTRCCGRTKLPRDRRLFRLTGLRSPDTASLTKKSSEGCRKCAYSAQLTSCNVRLRC